MYMIGILVGSPIFGAISDRIGRKKCILVSSLIFIGAGPLVALAPNFNLLMTARFILGAASPGIYATSFVLGN
jgi:predicted MFS family arabinose efflux permease